MKAGVELLVVVLCTTKINSLPLSTSYANEPDSKFFLEQVRLFFRDILPRHPQYEERPEQLEMALLVARALVDQELLVIEAGTGTGKSLAYLIPCLLWAIDYGGPIIISTRTLTLQEQLLEKDIPLLQQLIGLPFKVAAARGWSNYICWRRLESLQKNLAPVDLLSNEIKEITKSLRSGKPGIRQKLLVSDSLWLQIQADSHACSRQQCPHYQECYLFQERRQMERAHLIISNHSLVMADIALKTNKAQGILPKPAGWVLDEAHHLEDVAQEHLGCSLSLLDLQRIRQNVYDPKGKIGQSGWLPLLRERLSKMTTRVLLLESLDKGLLASLTGFYESGEEFFYWLSQTILQNVPGEVAAKITLHTDFYNSPEGAACQQLSLQWGGHIENVESHTRNLLNLLTSLKCEEEHESMFELQSLLERLKLLRQNLEFCIVAHSDDWVFWAAHNSNNTTLGATPLDIGQRLSTDFFASARSVILTSATLAVGQDLTFYKQRVGLNLHQNRITQKLLSSPFDFQQQTYLGVTTDLTDPNHNEFWQQSTPALLWLLQQLQGRTFLLTTSYTSLHRARDYLAPALEQAGIRVLTQGQAPPGLLINEFRGNSKSLLIGTDSFWEGVDIVGEDLSCILIAKLPFRVPSDPLVQAHCHRLEQAGKSSFKDYSLPQAILRFRQGFGRLIRSQNDRGIVMVLDSRLYHKTYGENFLQALPDCYRRAGRISELVQDAIKWLRGFT